MTLSSAVERLASTAAALGLLVGVLLFGFAVIVEPLTARRSGALDQIEQERVLLGRLLAEARALSARSGVTDVGAKESGFLAGSTDAEKIAALQARVEAVATASGVGLTSLQPSAERREGLLRFIGLRAVAAGTMDDVQRFLYGLEDGRPSLTIEAIDLAPSARTVDSGTLDLRLSIVGVAPAEAVQP